MYGANVWLRCAVLSGGISGRNIKARNNVSGEIHQGAQLFGGHRIPKGQSGNPGGRYMTRAVRRSMELYAALLVDLGGDEALSLMDKTFLAQACRLMAQAETNKNPEDAVRLSNAAARMLGKLRDMRRKAAELTFSEYLARGNDSAVAADSLDVAPAREIAATQTIAPRKRGRPPRRPSKSDEAR
jgi:hypothetical protein